MMQYEVLCLLFQYYKLMHDLNLELGRCRRSHNLWAMTKLLLNLVVAREGFLASWSTNVIQVILESGERKSLGNYVYMTILLGTIFGGFYGCVFKKSLLVDGQN